MKSMVPKSCLQRSPEQIRHHYEVEKALATRLRAAPREQRLHMLTGLYEELFRKVPDHPRLTRKYSGDEARRHITAQLTLVRRFVAPHMTVLEIGPGDCSFAFQIARYVRRVFGVDVDRILPANAEAPANFEFVLSDGVSVPIAANSIHIAYSNQLMEHLHPEDARDQLLNILTALTPGGRYICITPNRLTGPHDISRTFSDRPEGFHLREYSVTELERLFRAVGFRRVEAYAASKGFWVRVPMALIHALEVFLEHASPARRRVIGARWPIRRLLSPALIAVR